MCKSPKCSSSGRKAARASFHGTKKARFTKKAKAQHGKNRNLKSRRAAKGSKKRVQRQPAEEILQIRPRFDLKVCEVDITWLMKMLKVSREQLMAWMIELYRPILHCKIPGPAKTRPSKAMLQKAKRAVLWFYFLEEALGERGAIVHAFRRAAGGEDLHFDWEAARRRVAEATFDMHQKVDKWHNVLAMSHGDSNAEVSIAICGTKPISQRALTSVLCHEGLHNFATRKRQGHKWLSSDREHAALALLGDPIL